MDRLGSFVGGKRILASILLSIIVVFLSLSANWHFYMITAGSTDVQILKHCSVGALLGILAMVSLLILVNAKRLDSFCAAFIPFVYSLTYFVVNLVFVIFVAVLENERLFFDVYESSNAFLREVSVLIGLCPLLIISGIQLIKRLVTEAKTEVQEVMEERKKMIIHTSSDDESSPVIILDATDDENSAPDDSPSE